MELLNWSGVADFFQIDECLSKKQREMKIKNWLKNNVIPRSTTTKIGRDVLFIKEELEKFTLTRKGLKA
jgi:hypothetical protein